MGYIEDLHQGANLWYFQIEFFDLFFPIFGENTFCDEFRTRKIENLNGHI